MLALQRSLFAAVVVVQAHHPATESRQWFSSRVDMSRRAKKTKTTATAAMLTAV
jgi:hypothetical protein